MTKKKPVKVAPRPRAKKQRPPTQQQVQAEYQKQAPIAADPPAPAKHPGGRPKKVIEWEDVAYMASIHCSCDDIIEVTDTSRDTYDRHCMASDGVSFAQWVRKKQAHGRHNLRQAQMRLALLGDKTMQIWLGKQMLGQTDKVEKIDRDWAAGLKRTELLRQAEEALATLRAQAKDD